MGHRCEAPPMSAPAPTLEVCCASTPFAIAAEAAGANRVELCANLVEGGTTPSLGEIEEAVARLSVPVMVMIRPRGGDFLYSDVEFSIMKRDVEAVRRSGASGVVLGLLLPNGEIDVARTRALVDLARPMEVTFHRAFDVSRDLGRNLERLIDVGVERVLTSAGRERVTDALPRLADLASAAGDDITVLACGGVRPDNVEAVLAVPGIREVHIGASTTAPSGMKHRVEGVPMGRAYEPDEYTVEVADRSLIEGVARRMASIGMFVLALAAAACGTEGGEGEGAPVEAEVVAKHHGPDGVALSTNPEPRVVAYVSMERMEVYVDREFRDRASWILDAHISVSTWHWRIPLPGDDPGIPITPGDEAREFEELEIELWDRSPPGLDDIRVVLADTVGTGMSLSCRALQGGEEWLSAELPGPMSTSSESVTIREDYHALGRGTLHSDPSCGAAGDPVTVFGWGHRPAS